MMNFNEMFIQAFVKRANGEPEPFNTLMSQEEAREAFREANDNIYDIPFDPRYVEAATKMWGAEAVAEKQERCRHSKEFMERMRQEGNLP
jgi:hypothetical protein